MTGQAVSYDLNGNLTAIGSRSYVYSSQNQLLQAATLSGGTALYSYGPAARRVRANVGGVVTEFLHAGGMAEACPPPVRGQAEGRV
ncbi:hypothetical protein [uncultured Maricaulis sp.]|uniref:hypothetical protein n=1 Tax=uncultured Maricaulis sp. TaxID=174710 RepID=UPI0030DB5F22